MTTTYRRPRKDSKLGSLPPDQRARVDKWLFDKGLTYQEVAEACRTVLNLKVSRSSVARYFQRAMQERLAAQQARAEAKRLAEEKPDPARREQQYQLLLCRITEALWKMSGELMSGPNLRVVRQFSHLFKVLLASRREKNQSALVELAQDKWKLKQRQLLDQCMGRIRKKYPNWERPPEAQAA